jgi:hypothetical protein
LGSDTYSINIRNSGVFRSNTRVTADGQQFCGSHCLRQPPQDEDGTASPPPQVGCGLRNKPPKRQLPRASVTHPSVRPKATGRGLS